MAITQAMFNSPGLLVEGMKCNKKFSDHIKKILGEDVVPNCRCNKHAPVKHEGKCYDLEADIILLYPGHHDRLHVRLVEVKRPEKDVKREHINKALEQLKRDTAFILSILRDVPKENLDIQTFMAFPETQYDENMF